MSPTEPADSGTSLGSEFDLIVTEGLRKLQDIKAEVASHLPDLDELRSHFPDFDWELPNLEDLRAKIREMSTFTDVRSRLGDLGFEYIPTLSTQLQSLQSHFASIPSLSSLTAGPTGVLHDLIDTLLSSDLVEDLQEEAKRAQSQAEKAAAQVASALRHSLHGKRLVTYVDLPERWHNNEWVRSGYRFIPDLRSLLFSTFTLHNETGE